LVESDLYSYIYYFIVDGNLETNNMIEHLTSIDFIFFVLSFWLIVEYQQIGVQIANNNTFSGIPAVLALPNWLKSITLLLSNQFIVFTAILVVLIISFFSTPWYVGLIFIPIAYIFGLILFRFKILPSILGYYFLGIIGPLWLIGFINYSIHLLSIRL
jgi:hypothetical protein